LHKIPQTAHVLQLPPVQIITLVQGAEINVSESTMPQEQQAEQDTHDTIQQDDNSVQKENYEG